MPDEKRVRIARPEDLPVLVEILNQSIRWGKANAYTREFSVEERESWFEQFGREKSCAFVAELDGMIAGYCTLTPYRPGREALGATYEISFYVHEAYWRRGIGALLVRHTIVRGQKSGIKNLMAILMDINEPSRNLLERFGFKQWGHFPHIFDSGKVQCGQWVYGLNLSKDQFSDG